MGLTRRQRQILASNWDVLEDHFLDHLPVSTIAAKQGKSPAVVKAILGEAWEHEIQDAAVMDYMGRK